MGKNRTLNHEAKTGQTDVWMPLFRFLFFRVFPFFVLMNFRVVRDDQGVEILQELFVTVPRNHGLGGGELELFERTGAQVLE